MAKSDLFKNLISNASWLSLNFDELSCNQAKGFSILVQPTCEQHLAILEAVEDRDAATAGRFMTEHFQASKRITLSSFDQLQAQGTNTSLSLPADMLDEIAKISPKSRRERI